MLLRLLRPAGCAEMPCAGPDYRDRDPQLFLAPGDTVEVQIGDFGVLANPVGEPYPRAASALARGELSRAGR